MAEMVQLLDDLEGIELPHRPGVVHRLIAYLLDDPRLLEDGLGKKVLKTGLVQERPETLVVGCAQSRVVAIEPVDRRLEGESRVEARRPRIAHDL